MRPIQKVYIACHAGDVWMARCCVASIRRWHPDAPIALLKDSARRSFSTREIEEAWNVEAVEVPLAAGIGYAKLDLLFRDTEEHYLALDADIVFTGPLLDRLAEHEADFAVSWQKVSPRREELVRQWYLDTDLVRREVNPDYTFPGYVFNAGQIVATSGKLRREDFDPLIIWDAPPRARRPEVFKGGEQGMLNYLLPTLARAGRFTLDTPFFMLWPPDPQVERFSIEQMATGDGYPYLLHWAGLKGTRPSDLPRGEILSYFERFYYTRVAGGKRKAVLRALTRSVRALPRQTRNWLRGATPKEVKAYVRRLT